MTPYTVRAIPAEQTHDWLLHKHYAHRIPPITHSFGLYNSDLLLIGVCTYGTPARMLNNGYGVFGGKLPTLTLELNRLVIADGLPKNTLSFFVAQTFGLLPAPACLVSYADSNAGHHGYIYQATNWLFCGVTAKEVIYFNTRTNEVMHPRTIVSTYGSRAVADLPEWITVDKEAGGKYRYVMFVGTKAQRKAMRAALAYEVLPYPKGDNSRYDSTFEPNVQIALF